MVDRICAMYLQDARELDLEARGRSSFATRSIFNDDPVPQTHNAEAFAGEIGVCLVAVYMDRWMDGWVGLDWMIEDTFKGLTLTR